MYDERRRLGWVPLGKCRPCRWRRIGNERARCPLSLYLSFDPRIASLGAGVLHASRRSFRPKARRASAMRRRLHNLRDLSISDPTVSDLLVISHHWQRFHSFFMETSRDNGDYSRGARVDFISAINLLRQIWNNCASRHCA